MAARLERGHSALSPLRTVALGIGFACALAATVMIFLTDNPQSLRIGILIALWGFVFAALAAGRKQTEQAIAAGTEVELRKSYEAELEREVTARREYELRLEVALRRELQNDFSTTVGDLREEMSRLRRELSEQWDSELRVERMVMRTQSVRMGGERRDALEQGGPILSVSAPTEAAREGEVHRDRVSQYDGNGQRDSNGQYVGNSDYDFITQYAGDQAPNTREFPVVATGARSQPTAPVPPLLAPSSISSPPLPSEPPPPAEAPTSQDSEDVLTRVLAEAGFATGGRRRRHRDADEEAD